MRNLWSRGLLAAAGHEYRRMDESWRLDEFAHAWPEILMPLVTGPPGRHPVEANHFFPFFPSETSENSPTFLRSPR